VKKNKVIRCSQCRRMIIDQCFHSSKHQEQIFCSWDCVIIYHGEKEKEMEKNK
jgi:hypothetical protein